MAFETARPPNIPVQVVSLLRDARIEEALAELRRLGFPALQAVRVVHEVTGMSLNESKRLVHSSEAWTDSRADRDEFNSELAQAVGRLVDDLEAGREPGGV